MNSQQISYPAHGHHPGGGCWTCTYYRDIVSGGVHVLCGQNGRSVQAMPDRGCAYWVLEPGTDDELKYRDERYPNKFQIYEMGKL